MKKIGIIVASFALPLVASAQIRDVWSIFGFIKRILDTVLPLIIALAVVYFVWGIFKYVMAGDDDAKAAAKDKIIYGVVGLFVMISVWGLVNILVNTFGISNQGPQGGIVNPLPNIPNARF